MVRDRVAVLDKGSPVPVFTSITLSVELVVAADDEERARRLRTISNALEVPVTLQATVRAR